jgi:hypothetical protein
MLRASARNAVRCVLMRRTLDAAHAARCRSCRRFLAVSIPPEVGGRRQTARKGAYLPKCSPVASQRRCVWSAPSKPGRGKNAATLQCDSGTAPQPCDAGASCDATVVQVGKQLRYVLARSGLLNTSVPVCCADASLPPRLPVPLPFWQPGIAQAQAARATSSVLVAGRRAARNLPLICSLHPHFTVFRLSPHEAVRAHFI